MTLPLELLDTKLGIDSINFCYRIANRLGLRDCCVYGVLSRLGLKYSFYINSLNREKSWYVGVMLFWFGIFLQKNDEVDERDISGKKIGSGSFTGLRIWYKPRKYFPGEHFWDRQFTFGRQER